MKISNWLFHWLYVKKLKEQQSSSFKLKNETDMLRSNCILEIQNEIESLWLETKKVVYKLGIKSVQNNRARIFRDEFGKQSILPNPLFSQNQVVEFIGKYILYLLVIIIFNTAESFLYYLTAALFLPGAPGYMKIATAIFLALLIMFSLNYGFEKHFLYREVIERHSKKEITDLELKKYRDMRTWGYILMVLSFAAILFAGLARIFFLEHIPANGLSPEKLKSIQRASTMASMFTLFVTVITAIFMALIKQEQAKTAVKFRIFRYWHKANVSRNKYTQNLIRDANKLKLIVEQRIEKYWQLVIDLKRIFKIENEYDDKYEQLHQKYVALKAQPGFVVTEDIYTKFAPLQCAYEELFKHGVMNSKEVKEKITFAMSILKIPEDHLVEHLRIAQKPMPDLEPLLPVAESNGKLKARNS